MTDFNEDDQDKKPLSIKEGLQRAGETTGKIFSDLGKGIKGFFKDSKKNLQLTAEKIAIKRKENKETRTKKTIESWKKSKIGQGIMQIVKGDVEEIKSDTSQIKDDTAQIKEELAKILTTLNVIDFKASNIEEYLKDIVPKLEKSIETIENLEDHIKEHVGPKWKKIKYDWAKYKTGEISKGQFLIKGFLAIGRSFLPVFNN